MMYDDPTRHAAMLDAADALQEQAEKEYYKNIYEASADACLVRYFFNQAYSLFKALEHAVDNKYLAVAIETIANDLEGMALDKKIIEKGAELAFEAAVNGEE